MAEVVQDSMVQVFHELRLNYSTVDIIFNHIEIDLYLILLCYGGWDMV